MESAQTSAVKVPLNVSRSGDFTPLRRLGFKREGLQDFHNARTRARDAVTRPYSADTLWHGFTVTYCDTNYLAPILILVAY